MFIEVVYKATMEHDYVTPEEAEELNEQGLLYIAPDVSTALTEEDVYGEDYGD